MELKATLQLAGLSPSVYGHGSEREFSDDVVRNRKHHTIEAQSDSCEKYASKQVVTVPFKMPSKPLEAVDLFLDNKFQKSDPWKNSDTSSLETNFSMKLEKRVTGLVSYPQASVDPSQIRVNIWGDPGAAISKRFDVGSWTQPDPRFPSTNVVAYMGEQGPILFPGTGLPNIPNPQAASWNTFGIAPVIPNGMVLPNITNPNPQAASWNTFGLAPMIPNGSQDTRYPVGLQGTFMAPVSNLLDFSFPRQRCPDFEERGYCLRGDMCPMEHGVDRIVIEDVQCLSQFNLPVSISRANLLRKPTIPGPPAGTIIIQTTNDKRLNSKSKQGIIGNYSNDVDGVDLYDPDQPLWTNNNPEPPTLLLVQMPKFDQAESMLKDGSVLHMRESADKVWPRPENGKFSVWDKDKVYSAVDFPDDPEKKTKKNQDSGSKTIEFSPKTKNNTISFPRKPNQKADRTLYVKGIPQKLNKMESLLSHFKKFGEVVSIYIPVNSKQAFIQFSNREEAESALEAPDAVMGNRFIKLWWAYYDCVSGGGSAANSNAREPRTSSLPSDTKSIFCSRKDISYSGATKAKAVQNSAACPLPSEGTKFLGPDDAKGPHPLRNKVTSLEQLKKEYHQKQKMLEQKRQDFKRQLEKLEKQSNGIKGEVVATEAKRQKLVPASDRGKLQMPRSSDTDSGLGNASNSTDVASSCAKLMENKKSISENSVAHDPKADSVRVLHESHSLKQPTGPLSPLGASFAMNRLQLDKRPTAFKIIPPLPSGLGNAAALKEHFASYGEITTVELENVNGSNDTDGSREMKNCSALIKFTTRESAETAFANGKCWKGHFMQFLWVKSNESSNENHVAEQIFPSAAKEGYAASLEPTLTRKTEACFAAVA